jgi:hypothetical protein
MPKTKIVDASRDGMSVTGATLRISDARLVTSSPREDVIVPYWVVYFVLKTDYIELDRPMMEVPYMLDTDPLEAAMLAFNASHLPGWTVTRIVDGE